MGGPGSGRRPGVKNQSKNKLKQSKAQKVYNATRRSQSSIGRTNRNQNKQTANMIRHTANY